MKEEDLRAKRRQKEKNETLKERIKGLEEKEDRLYEDFTKGLLDEVSYKRHLKRTKEEKKELENTYKAENSMSERDFLKRSESLLELANSAESLWRTRSHRLIPTTRTP